MKFLHRYENFLIQENTRFNTVEQFLLNPLYKNQNWETLLGDFYESGGEIVDGGSFAQIYSHPQWPYVLKVFASDDCYLKFMRWAYANPHMAVPRFYDKPRRIIPHYQRKINNEGQGKLYVVRMERLYPLEMEMSEYRKYIGEPIESSYNYVVYHGKISLPEDEDWRYVHVRQTYKKYMEDLEKDVFSVYPSMRKVMETWGKMDELGFFGCVPDPKWANFMQRKNGDIIIIDPIWHDFYDTPMLNQYKQFKTKPPNGNKELVPGGMKDSRSTHYRRRERAKKRNQQYAADSERIRK